MTRSNNISAGGFSKKIDVQFRHGCKERCHCKPTVLTCSFEMTLLLNCSSEEDMKLMMIEAICNSHKGFDVFDWNWFNTESFITVNSGYQTKRA